MHLDLEGESGFAVRNCCMPRFGMFGMRECVMRYSDWCL